MTHAYQGNGSSFLRNLMVFALALFIFGWAATDGARAADPNLWTVTGVTGMDDDKQDKGKGKDKGEKND